MLAPLQMHPAALIPMPPPAATTPPWVVVQRQLEAFNARDVDALLAIYADDAQQFEHPAKLVASGTAELRARFAARFSDPILHAALNNRIVMDNVVVDYETVTRTFPEGPGTVELVAIYELRQGRIAKAWFIPGRPTLPRRAPAA